MTPATTGTAERFWALAADPLGEGRLQVGTLMGFDCLRSAASNEFVATAERSSGRLIVKLHRNRVAELIDQGVGEPFAPAKRVFKEWVAIADYTDTDFDNLIAESLRFVDKADA